MATEVFTLLNAEIISEGSARLGSVALQLHDSQHQRLSELAKDLDRETSRTDTGNYSDLIKLLIYSPLFKFKLFIVELYR